MGSGKSSILQGLAFGLFGQLPEVSSRRLKLEDLVMRRPKRADRAEVEVEFESEGIIYTVRRVIQEGSGDAELFREGRLWEQGITRVTTKVQELIGIDFDTFNQVVYARQNELDHFMRLGKGDRMKLIDGLLKIDKMTEARTNLLALRRSQEKRLEDLRVVAKENTAWIEERIHKLEDEIRLKQSEYDQLSENLSRLDSQRLQFREQDARLETARNRMEGLARQQEGCTRNLTFLEKQLKTLPDIHSPETKLAELRKNLSDLRSRLSNLKATRTSDLRELEEANLKLAEIQTAELLLTQDVPDLSGPIRDAMERQGSLRAEIQSRETAISQLREAKAECPVCGHAIKDPVSHIREHEARLHQLKADIKDLELSLASLQTRQKQSDALRLKILRAREVVREKPKVEASLKNLQSKSWDKDIKEIEDKISEMENRESELKRSVDRVDVQNKIKEVKNELTDLETQLKDVRYDKSEHDLIREKFQKVNGEYLQLKARADMLPQIIDRNRSLVIELTSQRDRIVNARQTVQKGEAGLEALKVLSNVLVDVQIVIRQKFVEAVNELLSDIWGKLYPYDDYSGLRLMVETDGRGAGDYVLQVRESGGWVGVDGFTSGGERSLAALSLRVAFARALSHMGTLLLDEPTHNLDSSGIEQLIEVLKEGMPEVLDQVVLITHESDMEKAATGLSYRLARDSNDATLVEQFE